MTNDQKQILAEIVIYLKRTYYDDSIGHGWLHLERVWKMARKLAEGENVDHFIVGMAALLHDVDDFKFKKPGEDPMYNSKKILSRYQIEDALKEQIIEIATHVSYKGAHVADVQPSLEGQIVQDADRLDALGAMGISRTFAYNGQKGSPIYDPSLTPVLDKSFEQYKTQKSSAINHFYEKLLLLKDRMHTQKAKEIAKRRHAYIVSFLEEFWAEVEGKR